MKEIKHNLAIKAAPEKIFEALTTQKQLAGWWTSDTTARAETGSVNVFIFGKFRNEMKVTRLTNNKLVEWKCISSIDEWIGTEISFELEEKNDRTLLRFSHRGWKEVTDTFAGCNYDWAMSLKSLKLLCETGTGTPHQQISN
jgi:uncharacterized protein YndB with AHSA1/START domain